MAKKITKYSKNKTVKDLARKRVGPPRPARPLDERDKRAEPKHKKSWLEEQ
jgi:hypothetical protein